MQTKKSVNDAPFEVFDLSKVSKRTYRKLAEKPITFWIPIEAKAGYDHLQDLSGNEFGKSFRVWILKYIEAAVQKNKAG